jgi:hypothetical protein
MDLHNETVETIVAIAYSHDDAAFEHTKNYRILVFNAIVPPACPLTHPTSLKHLVHLPTYLVHHETESLSPF